MTFFLHFTFATCAVVAVLYFLVSELAKLWKTHQLLWNKDEETKNFVKHQPLNMSTSIFYCMLPLLRNNGKSPAGIKDYQDMLIPEKLNYVSDFVEQQHIGDNARDLLVAYTDKKNTEEISNYRTTSALFKKKEKGFYYNLGELNNEPYDKRLPNFIDDIFDEFSRILNTTEKCHIAYLLIKLIMAEPNIVVKESRVEKIFEHYVLQTMKLPENLYLEIWQYAQNLEVWYAMRVRASAESAFFNIGSSELALKTTDNQKFKIAIPIISAATTILGLCCYNIVDYWCSESFGAFVYILGFLLITMLMLISKKPFSERLNIIQTRKENAIRRNNLINYITAFCIYTFTAFFALAHYLVYTGDKCYTSKPKLCKIKNYMVLKTRSTGEYTFHFVLDRNDYPLDFSKDTYNRIPHPDRDVIDLTAKFYAPLVKLFEQDKNEFVINNWNDLRLVITRGRLGILVQKGVFGGITYDDIHRSLYVGNIEAQRLIKDIKENK